MESLTRLLKIEIDINEIKLLLHLSEPFSSHDINYVKDFKM